MNCPARKRRDIRTLKPVSVPSVRIFWTRDEATSLTMMTAILQGRMGHPLSLTAVNEM